MDNLENGEFLTSSYPTSTSYSTVNSIDAVFNSRRIDYILAPHELASSISSLRVLEFTAISDHTPLLYTLNTPVISNLFNSHENVVDSRPVIPGGPGGHVPSVFWDQAF